MNQQPDPRRSLREFIAGFRLPVYQENALMHRRQILKWSLLMGLSGPLFAAEESKGLDEADRILTKATASGQVKAATLHVVQRGKAVTRAYGDGTTADSMFLLGSISKPICVSALMRLYDQREFKLDDPLNKFLPEFTGQGREHVTIRHLLTHTSGLPDQVVENARLRREHASLAMFIDHAQRESLAFSPGSKYQYSSMGILLAMHVAETITGKDILSLVDETVLEPLKMTHSAQGLGRFQLDDMVPCQTEFAAPEAGSGEIPLPKIGIGTVSIGESWDRPGERPIAPRRTSRRFSLNF